MKNYKLEKDTRNTGSAKWAVVGNSGIIYYEGSRFDCCSYVKLHADDINAEEALEASDIKGDSMKHGMNFEDLELMDGIGIKKELKKCAPFRAILKDHGIGWRDFSNYGQIYIETSYREASILMGKWNGIYDYNVCSIKGDKITAN